MLYTIATAEGYFNMPTNSGERPPFEIVPIKRVDVYGSVLAQLNALISESGMKPGDRLPSERELVERLRVSRVLVREALRALEGMGKIEIRSNAGSFLIHPNGNAMVTQLKAVLPVDITFLKHLVDVRAAVEDKVIALVAARTVADISEINDLLQREEAELDKRVEVGSLDLRFEAALAKVSGNPLLQELQRSVHRLWVEAWSECGITPGDRRRLHAEHRAVYEALTRGDGELARQLMAEHVDRTVEMAVPSTREESREDT